MKDRTEKQSRLKVVEDPADEANIYTITQPLVLQFTYALHLVVHFLVLQYNQTNVKLPLSKTCKGLADVLVEHS